MGKTCDNKSVGILIWKNGALLMIERKKYNFGYAIPAGHQDGDDEETTAKKELEEEVGLKVEKLEEKLKESLPNPCKREGGTRHEWTIMEATRWSDEINPSTDETKSYIWAEREKIEELKTRLESFAEKTGNSLEKEFLPQLVRATNENPEWQKNPGLEPPMYFLFKKLGII